VRQLVIGWGIPPHKVHIVQNALTETPRIDITRNEAKQRIGLRGSLVCTVARLYAWKRVDLLLEMVPAFTGDSTLVIVGDGPEQAALENRARSLGVADRVRFVGRIPHHEVHLYLRAADVFVLNTSYEGLSHTLIETRSVGTPIVTTDIGGNREILKNEETALLVPVGDPESFVAAVNRLLNSPELRQNLAQAATRGLEHYIWDRLVDETMEIIDKLIKPQPVTKPPEKA
jgi:glycosyltransferase involved in cell wall biosynthesis